MSKEVGGMVRSKRVKGIRSARPESAPTARRLGRAPEKLAYRTPLEARKEYELRQAA